MKTEKDFEPLKEYVQKWKLIDGLKPKNEPEFVAGFVALLNNYPDEREVEFNGEGAYFGKQVTLNPFSFYGRTSGELDFEIAYCDSHIVVYNANHNGFWHPEYISMDKSNPDFDELHKILMAFLRKVFGV